jgi:hypothetical protein
MMPFTRRATMYELTTDAGLSSVERPVFQLFHFFYFFLENIINIQPSRIAAHVERRIASMAKVKVARIG